MKKKITVIGLGLGGADQLTVASADLVRKAQRLVFRTARHPVAEALAEEGVAFTTLDAFHEQYADFDLMYEAMAQALWAMAAEGPVTYAVSDLTADASVSRLYQQKPSGGELLLLPGLSIAACCISLLGGLVDASQGLCVLPASAVSTSGLSGKEPILITEIDNRQLAGDVKLALCHTIGDETEVTLLPSLTARKVKPKQIPACEIDRQRQYDHTVGVYVPAYALQKRDRYCFENLLELVEILRAPDGCPWDRVQTHESMRQCLIEEAYEAAGAIDEQDDDHLFDELGDVLFQVVFHASIGRQQGSFDISDVITAVCRKMISRHPKLFPVDDSGTAQDAAAIWDDMKMKERKAQSTAELMRSAARALPALMRADKVLKQMEKAGASPAACEDTAQAQACSALLDQFAGEGALSGETAGDLLLTLVRLCRLNGLNPEEALNKATDRLISRFDSAERQADYR